MLSYVNGTQNGFLIAVAVTREKHILAYGLIYGLCGGLLIVALKLVEYRFLVVEHSVEIYGGLIALVFASLGIWLGLKLTRREEIVVEREVIVERAVGVSPGVLRHSFASRKRRRRSDYVRTGLRRRHSDHAHHLRQLRVHLGDHVFQANAGVYGKVRQLPGREIAGFRRQPAGNIRAGSANEAIQTDV
jgi:hypothetical protein